MQDSKGIGDHPGDEGEDGDRCTDPQALSRSVPARYVGHGLHRVHDLVDNTG